ncbi:unnamed protein product [Bursaphelenchus okinawaensis]|uniref:Uncharacterized protein n=1 Tax=Bursaphelenchus okinawaensis TaxID=465554 RepID=A0A811KC43_9BILA|nr:unnamed protein product [Bursaphelenchus okinawaensis]CAG9101398.1 unnamed protein product [Bursaphelenchus okinawaensis]
MNLENLKFFNVFCQSFYFLPYISVVCLKLLLFSLVSKQVHGAEAWLVDKLSELLADPVNRLEYTKTGQCYDNLNRQYGSTVPCLFFQVMFQNDTTNIYKNMDYGTPFHEFSHGLPDDYQFDVVNQMDDFLKNINSNCEKS